jgi:hypothetical protein
MSGFTYNFPVIITTAGVQPTPPATLNTQLIADVAATSPGYTILPAGLIEDLSSTATGALVLIDTARVETLNALTIYGANAFLVAQLGLQAGIVQGTPVNTSVNVVFSGTAGFVISAGFLVGDGTHTYQVVSGGIIGSGGSSPAITAVAVDSGSWAVPANSVTIVLTSVPVSIGLTVTNPVAGVPATTTETEQSYRSRCIQAGLASAQGMPSFIKTMILNVPGVVARTVAVHATLGSGLLIIAAGGDVDAVAYAIYSSVFDPSALLSSALHPGDMVTVTINDYPDTYQIPFLDPPTQAVTLTLTWNTNQSNFTQGDAVNAAAVAPLAAYINSIPTGAPINALELNDTFVNAVAGILDENTISKMSWTVTIAGTPVSPTGTLYQGDVESYLTIASTDITLTQG